MKKETRKILNMLGKSVRRNIGGAIFEVIYQEIKSKYIK